MKEAFWNKKLCIGDLPPHVQSSLANWCIESRKGDPLLLTTEQWTIHEIVHAWLEYNSISGCTYEVLVLMDAINEARDK